MLCVLKFVRVTGLGLVGAGCAVTAWPPHAAHTVASHAVKHVTVLDRSSRLGLAEAGRSEPLAPRPAALPAPLRSRCCLTSRCCRCHRVALIRASACSTALPLPGPVGCRPHMAVHAAVALSIMALRPRGPRWSDARTRCP